MFYLSQTHVQDKRVINIYGLGNRYIDKDFEQIKWYLKSASSRYKNKAQKSKYWLDAREALEEILIELSAFELLAFICEFATDHMMDKRRKFRVKNDAKNKKADEDFNAFWITDRLLRSLNIDTER